MDEDTTGDNNNLVCATKQAFSKMHFIEILLIAWPFFSLFKPTLQCLWIFQIALGPVAGMADALAINRGVANADGDDSTKPTLEEGEEGEDKNLVVVIEDVANGQQQQQEPQELQQQQCQE